MSGGGGALTVTANSDIRLSAGNWTGDAGYKIQAHSGGLYIQAPIIRFRSNNGSDRWYIQTNGELIPAANDSYDIGSSSNRVRNIYTQDLQLSNESKKDKGGNDVDGTWGDFTIQEGESDLFLINNRSGKKYKFNLTEVS